MNEVAGRPRMLEWRGGGRVAKSKNGSYIYMDSNAEWSFLLVFKSFFC